MKKFLIPILVLIAVLCLGGAAYAKKHSDDVKYAKAVATVKTKNKRLKTAYENKLAQYENGLSDWESNKADYENCKETTAPVFTAMDKVEGLVAGGTNYDDYNDAVVDLNTAINGLSRDFDIACMNVSLSLDAANSAHAKAAGIWMEWYNDVGISDHRDLEDLPLQPQWTKADRAIARADRALSKMKRNVGFEPEEPVEPKYVAVPKKSGDSREPIVLEQCPQRC